MFRRASVLTACGVALAVLHAAASAPASSGASRLTYLSVSGAVELPGVTLQAGTYAFEIANPDSSADVVRVSNRAHTKVFFAGYADRVARPADMRWDGHLQLAEAKAGTPARIIAWYPTGESEGFRFRYRQ